ncbi:MAG: class I SAM-dependent methyltransferase [Helicobacteraceae bacterium]|jgi:SAM-dependent methyltransferase|nr:class I SAM-dependent methyltransferase [Helicobacteraceae bacterium]
MTELDLYAQFEPLIVFLNEIDDLHSRYVDILSRVGAKSVLDIGCGSGDLLVKIRSFAPNVKGIDISAEMIRRAKLKGVNAECVDIASENGTYDTAISVFDVVNYFRSDELPRFFSEALKRIERYFIFDVNTHYGFAYVATGDLVQKDGDVTACVQSTFERDIFISDFDLFSPLANGCYERSSWQIAQYYHPKELIVAALKEAGFDDARYEDIWLYGAPQADKTLFIAER